MSYLTLGPSHLNIRPKTFQFLPCLRATRTIKEISFAAIYNVFIFSGVVAAFNFFFHHVPNFLKLIQREISHWFYTCRASFFVEFVKHWTQWVVLFILMKRTTHCVHHSFWWQQQQRVMKFQRDSLPLPAKEDAMRCWRLCLVKCAPAVYSWFSDQWSFRYARSVITVQTWRSCIFVNNRLIH